MTPLLIALTVICIGDSNGSLPCNQSAHDTTSIAVSATKMTTWADPVRYADYTDGVDFSAYDLVSVKLGYNDVVGSEPTTEQEYRDSVQTLIEWLFRDGANVVSLSIPPYRPDNALSFHQPNEPLRDRADLFATVLEDEALSTVNVHLGFDWRTLGLMNSDYGDGIHYTLSAAQAGATATDPVWSATPPAVPVPEPSTLLMSVVGFAAMGLIRKANR